LSSLQVHLLGGFQLIYNDQPITGINQARQQSVLAYLLLHSDAPQSRQHLAFLFWPDSTERQARANLRHILHQLRRNLPDVERYLSGDTQTLHWRPDGGFRLDVAAFESAIAQADEAQDGQATRLALEDAVELYRGDLLPGWYDEWVLPERDRLSGKFVTALERLVELCREAADYAAAIGYAQRLLRHDPVHEGAYRRLMQLHALNGDRARALSVYHTCATILQQEFGVEPSPATQEAYRRLVNQEWSPTAVAQQPARTPGAPAAAPRLIGRRGEWEQLQAAWRTALRGRSGFVLISGEAGIGKTCLAEELLLWANQRGVPTARTRAYAAEGRLAYAPVTDWLRSEAYREHLSRLEDVWLSEVARLLPETLVGRPRLAAPLPMTESWQRQRLFEALARAVLQGDRPLLLHIDDLQWCDRETLEWLHYLLRFDVEARLLFVGTARPEDVDADHPLGALLHGLRDADQLTEIDLGPLDADETAELAQDVASYELDESALAQLYDETEGVPLFVVETVRAGLAEGADGRGVKGIGSSPTLPRLHASAPLPPKVCAVIQSRFNQLSAPARELASLGAIIGRSFTFDVLARASNDDEDAVVRGLDELWQRRLIREQGANAYDFSHDRIRDVAYAEISPVQRSALHRRVAQALESLHAADLDTVSGLIAAHWEQAGNLDRAIAFYQGAGVVAQQVYANAEAIGHFARGLQLLTTLPRTTLRDQRELELLTALGVPLVAQYGYAADEVRAAYVRAHALCHRLGQPHSAPVLRALAISCAARNQLSRAYDYGNELLDLAERDQDPVTRVESHYVLGVTAFWQGEFSYSREHLEQGIARYDPAHHATHIAMYAQDPKAICLSRLAVTQWCLGYPDQASRTSEEAVALARAMGHPFSQAYVFAWTALLHNHRRDLQATLNWAEATIRLSSQHEWPFWLGIGMFLEGWALSAQGKVEIGIDQMNAGMATFRTTRSDFLTSYFAALLAQLESELGEAEHGLAMLAKTLTLVKERGESWCEAELNRLQGEVMLAHRSDPAQVEASYRRAIEVARKQNAKSLELRAAISLVRLWLGQGKVLQARQMLAKTYGWFTEGFDTADLKETMDLLTGQVSFSRETHAGAMRVAPARRAAS
jgi:DNA-binding SARP family transcriptional activator/predicted ATPase